MKGLMKGLIKGLEEQTLQFKALKGLQRSGKLQGIIQVLGIEVVCFVWGRAGEFFL